MDLNGHMKNQNYEKYYLYKSCFLIQSSKSLMIGTILALKFIKKSIF